MREGRNSDEPGHAARVAEALREREEALIGTVSSPRLKQQVRARLNEWGGNLRAREGDWEFLRQQEVTVENFVEQRGIVEGRTRRAATPNEFGTELQLQFDAIDTLNVSDEVKGKLRNETEQVLSVSFLRGLTDRDPEAARALIDEGAFDGILSGDQVEALRNGTEVEIRRVEAQRQREQADQIAAVRQSIGIFEIREGAGLVSDETEFDEPIALARAIGDEEKALRLTVLQQNTRFMRVLGPENATALQRSNRLAELNGKDKRSDLENLELAFLQRHAPAWASAERADPVGQSKLRGGSGAPPVIDPADGLTWNARAAWAGARNAPLFDKDEVAAISEQLQTPQGEVAVLAELDKIADPAAKARAAQQLAPNDPTFRQISMLGPKARATIRQGRKAMANNPKFFSDLDLDVEEQFIEADRVITSALREFDVDLADGAREVMRQFIAGNATGRGLGSFSDVPDRESVRRLIRVSMAVAMGGSVQNGRVLGGFDDWNGRPYALPETMDEPEFKQVVNQRLREVADNPPINPDGSPANLFRAVPVAMGGGVYQWETTGGKPIKQRQGDRLVNFRMKVGP